MPTFDEMYNDLIKTHDIENKWGETMANWVWCRKAGVSPWHKSTAKFFGSFTARERARAFDDDVKTIWNHYCKPKHTNPATSEVVDEEPADYAYVIKSLFSHVEKPQWLILYETNPDFAKAAEKLAYNLAHALANSPKGTRVRRRKCQSLALFDAALHFLFKNLSGLEFFYDTNYVELA